MAVGLEHPGDLRSIPGVRIGVTAAGIRKFGRRDLALFEICESATVCGVFTRNKARAAPVQVAIDRLAAGYGINSGKTRALVINSGVANAGVGNSGLQDCLEVCRLVSMELGIEAEFVLPFSTGIIGERLPVNLFETHMRECVDSLDEENWLAAAEAIMTTDTIPKGFTKVIKFGPNERVTITGIAKGSGMIRPDMATMLSFIATDARMEPDSLRRALNQAVDRSFNRISVDGDTSTNDSCILIATGMAGIDTDANEQRRQAFDAGLEDVLRFLAQAIVRDGEGATKFVTIRVTGGKQDSDCKKVAATIANSPLVKTALHASDPNWGRIYAAIGRSGAEDLDMSRVGFRIGDVEVMNDGALSARYSETSAAATVSGPEIYIGVDLGMGKDTSATVWTCDLSAEYVRINAEYRT